MAAGVMVLVFAAAAQAREWIVTPHGKAGAAGTAADPAGLYDAVSRVLPGDTVTLANGTYMADRVLSLEAENVTLRGADGSRPAISASAGEGRVDSVILVEAKGCVLSNLDVAGGGTYVVKVDAPKCTITLCALHGSGRDCVKLAVTGDGAIIEKCEIYDSGLRDKSNAEGIDNVACDDVIVRNCHIHDIATNGLYMKGGARRCLIENNHVTDCGDNGIMFGQSTDKQWNENWPYECLDSVARGNIVERIQGAGLSFEAAKNCRFEGNYVYDAGKRSHGGASAQANPDGTACVDVTFDGNTIVMLADMPMIAVHEGGLKDMGDMKCDRNTYYRKSGACAFSYEPTGILARGIDAWRKATGYDANSTVAETEPPRPRTTPEDGLGGRGAERNVSR